MANPSGTGRKVPRISPRRSYYLARGTRLHGGKWDVLAGPALRDQERGIEAAAGAVEAALRDAGFEAERQDQIAGLADIFPGMGEGLTEWIVTDRDGAEVTLQLAYLNRVHEPVATEIGPVLDIEDVAAGKVCVLASRVEPRDYADTARMLQRYSPAQLIGLARRLDPGLTAQDFAEAGQRLDQIDDAAFARYGLESDEVADMRKRFATWPEAGL